jgi:phytanoyl-CoA hydroxylase
MSAISKAMLQHYQDHGYVVVPNLIEPDHLQIWIDRLSDIVEGRTPPSPGMLVMKDVMVAKGTVKAGSRMEAIAKIQDFENDPVLDSYTTHAAILECVETIVGKDVQTIHTMLINKPPHVDGRHPLHQDLLYFPFRPADKIVASWTALEPVTRENGCLVVLPDSHRGELLQHGNPHWDNLNAGYFGAKGVDTSNRVHLEMNPGDTVFFHPILVHGSGRNKTEGFRRAISAHYCAVDVEWDWATEGAFGNRQYRIVSGDKKGQFWSGERFKQGGLDPRTLLSSSDDLESIEAVKKRKQ